MQLIQDLEITEGAKVLLRCDLNLPQDSNGKFTDYFRLESSVPTISYLLDLGSTVYIVAHLGKPKGQKVEEFSLKPLAEIISNQIGQKVDFVEDPFKLNGSLKDKSGVILIQNLRFWPGEEQNSPQFAKDLVEATGAQFFVQDGFGTCHREHASFVQLPALLPSAAGFLLQKEVEYLGFTKTSSLGLIVGGAKVESKLPVILNFIDKATVILTGGVVANTLLVSSGSNVAASLIEKSCLELASSVIASTSKSKNSKLYLPHDYLAATSIDSKQAEHCDSSTIKDDQLILDLGSETIKNYQDKLNDHQAIIWAGTLGYAEKSVFSGASKQILNYLLELKTKNKDLKIIIGGGDTVDFVRGYLSPEQQSQISHLSTGGSASLLLLSGQELPGIVALEPENDANKKFQPIKHLSLKDRLAVPSAPPSLSAESDQTSTSLKSEEDFKSNSKVNNSDINPSSPLYPYAPILTVNLKSNFTLDQLKVWLDQVLSSEPLLTLSLNLSLAIPSVFLEEATSIINSKKLNNPPQVYAENISVFETGAHTGEVAASMLKSIATGTLIGHSERRFTLNETLQEINLKLERAINAGLQITLCVGSKSHDSDVHKVEVYKQLNHALVKFDSRTIKLLAIAYEPAFAIGSGLVPDEEFLSDQLSSIKLNLKDKGFNVPLLYGGSVDPANTNQIMKVGFSGLLVGTIGLDPAKLTEVGINMLG